MPSNTYRKAITSATAYMLFGNSKDRTSWMIYNATTGSIFWSNTRMSQAYIGMSIPSNTAFSVNIPEDDPSKEVWIISVNSGDIYIYEGFNPELMAKWRF